MRAERRLELEWRQGKQKPLATGPGKRFPAWFPHAGEVYPAGRHRAPQGKIPKEDGGRRWTPGPGLPRRCCGASAGLLLKVGHHGRMNYKDPEP